MNKYKCKVCSYIYDPAENEGKSFEDLPADWTCPQCGAAKTEFEVIHQLGEEYTGGEAQEKHVPVIERENGNATVKIGSVPHPMLEEHYITKVELYDGDKLIQTQNLAQDSQPIVVFHDVPHEANLKALAYCNLHGVWESQ